MQAALVAANKRAEQIMQSAAISLSVTVGGLQIGVARDPIQVPHIYAPLRDGCAGPHPLMRPLSLTPGPPHLLGYGRACERPPAVGVGGLLPEADQHNVDGLWQGLEHRDPPGSMSEASHQCPVHEARAHPSLTA